MRNTALFPLAAIVFGATACAQTTGSAAAITAADGGAAVEAAGSMPAEAGDPAFIRVFEGGCFYPSAGCPTYTATLTPDGRLRLEGQTGVRTPGLSEVDLGADAWRAAQDALAAAAAAGMPTRVAPDTAPPPAPDGAPWCMFHGAGFRVTIADAAGDEREIYWDTACRHAPEAMPALRQQLREIVGFETRIKIEG